MDVQTHQWMKNGDHPRDDADGGKREGGIVRYFRRPDVNGERGCAVCGCSFDSHGWLDELDIPVCPGDCIVEVDGKVVGVCPPTARDLMGKRVRVHAARKHEILLTGTIVGAHGFQLRVQHDSGENVGWYGVETTMFVVPWWYPMYVLLWRIRRSIFGR